MAKYDSLRKPEKKRLIREYRAAHPELSYKEVGDMFGVDAAWAWRICKEGDKPCQTAIVQGEVLIGLHNNPRDPVRHGRY